MTIMVHSLPFNPIYTVLAGTGNVDRANALCRRTWSEKTHASKCPNRRRAFEELERIKRGGWLPRGGNAMRMYNCRLPQLYPGRRRFYADWAQVFCDGELIQTWTKPKRDSL